MSSYLLITLVWSECLVDLHRLDSEIGKHCSLIALLFLYGILWLPVTGRTSIQHRPSPRGWLRLRACDPIR